MKQALRKKQQKIRRAARVRAKIHGTKDVPRLSVSRSAKHTSAQLIDDDKGATLIQASDRDVQATEGQPIVRAKEVGKVLAERAKAAGIVRAVFDRGSYRYHGRVAALAQGAREGGLTF